MWEATVGGTPSPGGAEVRFGTEPSGTIDGSGTGASGGGGGGGELDPGSEEVDSGDGVWWSEERTRCGADEVEVSIGTPSLIGEEVVVDGAEDEVLENVCVCDDEEEERSRWV